MKRRLQLLMPWCFYTIKTLLCCGIVSEKRQTAVYILYLSVITVLLGRFYNIV
jgi:hypothetical protein